MSRGAAEVAAIREKFSALRPTMNEAVRRLWVAAEARALGRGGLALVSTATGISLPTIRKGIRELESGEHSGKAAQTSQLSRARIRRPGGGRKPLTAKDPTLLADLEALLRAEPRADADPAEPLRFSPLLPGQLQRLLHKRGHVLSAPSLVSLLGERGYRWHAQAQRADAAGHQALLRWRYIEARAQQFLRCGQPVVAVELTRCSAGESRRDAAPGQAAGRAAAAARSLLLHPDISSAALIGAALHAFFSPLRQRLLQSAEELLIVVGLGRRRSAASLWQAECRRLGEALRLRVQLVLVPAGIYRWQRLQAPMRYQVVQPGPGPLTRSAALSIGLVASHPLFADEHAGRLYERAYPDGLITDENTGPLRDSWSAVPACLSQH